MTQITKSAHLIDFGTEGLESTGAKGLGKYLGGDALPLHADTIIWRDDEFLLLRDKFPKATVHFLLMNQKKKVYTLHPLRAMADPEILQAFQSKINSLQDIIFAEISVMLPGASREILDIFKFGIHARPSMRDLHVHIISRDLCGLKMNTSKKYNSFLFPFFVELNEFPLHKSHPAYSSVALKNHLTSELVCCKCKTNFKKKFKSFRRHLEEERDVMLDSMICDNYNHLA